MLDSIRDINSILFFDIETVPGTPQYSDLDETWQYLWKHKAKSILKKYDDEITEEDAASCYDRAGIYAEFGKIICISVGVFYRDKNTQELLTYLSSFADDDEEVLLKGFADFLNKKFNDSDRQFMCGHNI